MPRPELPRLVSRPRKTKRFSLTAREKNCISQTLRLRELSERTVASIEEAVNCYRATVQGSESTTVKNTLLALANLEKTGRSREEAILLLADDRAGVDYTTLDALQGLAKAALQKEAGADKALVKAARKRIGELMIHPRIATSIEPLRQFCGIVRLIFNKATPHLRGRINEDEAWRLCRRFALEIFDTAGIDHADFDAHPERLTEYLGTDVGFNSLFALPV